MKKKQEEESKEKKSVVTLYTIAKDKMVEDGVEFDPSITPDAATLAKLDTYQNKNRITVVRNHLANVVKILENDPRWKGFVRFNQLKSVVEFKGQPIRDVDESALAIQLQDIYQLSIPSTRASEAFRYVAEQNQFHPVRDYLESLKWDGTKRVDKLLSFYFGAENNKINQVMGRRFMVGCVSRAYKLGSKMATVSILVGKQGALKSTAFQKLAGSEWFSDTALDLNSKGADIFSQISGVWLYELAELHSLRRAEVTKIKSFISSQVDRFRKSYGRNAENQPRSCVFVGTTNETSGFLSDSTGSRRFWPCRVGQINIPMIEEDRDQLWAEAVALFKMGEQWWLKPEEEKIREDVATNYEIEDPWAAVIREFLLLRVGQPVTVQEIMAQALKMDPDRRAAHHTRRIAAILKQSGRERKRIMLAGSRQSVWVMGENSS